MTSPSGAAPPPPTTGPAGPERPRHGGSSVGLTAIVLVVISAAAVFWAGLSLGSAPAGRNADERAAIEAFTQTYQRIADDYIGTPLPEEVLEGALEGMFEVLDDPHSRYMRPDEYGAALDDARGEFEGIGAVMATRDRAGEPCESIDDGCRLLVVEVLAGAPAEAAGLAADDIVVGVDGTPLEGASVDDSVLLIRGPRGSEVALTLERAGEEVELVITRDTVVTDDVHTAVLADGRIGYVGVDNFSTGAADDFEEALRAHLDAGIDGIIVDVRDDPGGFVDATVDIASEFIADGAVLWEEDASGRQEPVDVSGGGIATDPSVEVVVLVNGGSASASEILGGALQDAGRARLVGEPTFGKGTVQEWSELPGENGGYRLSVAKWLTRDKRWLDGEGLTPDVTVPAGERRYRASVSGADPEADPQLQAAISLLLDEPVPTTGREDVASTTGGEEPGGSAAPAASRVPTRSPTAGG